MLIKNSIMIYDDDDSGDFACYVVKLGCLGNRTGNKCFETIHLIFLEFSMQSRSVNVTH